MKTDKKKLMRKMIAISLMAAMLTSNAMTYGADLMLPAVTAEALTVSEEGATTYNLSTMTPNAEGIIAINIAKNGTYIFTGSNYRADGDAFIDVQVTVPAGVEADFIFDGLDLRNNSYEPAYSGAAYINNPFIINGTVNIYIKSESGIDIDLGESYQVHYAYAFSSETEGTVNIMESDNNSKLTIIDTDNVNVNVKGGNLELRYMGGGSFSQSDGIVNIDDFPSVNPIVVDGGYIYLKFYFSSVVNSAGETLSPTTIYGLPEDAKVTEVDGKELNYAYANGDGEFYTFLPDLSDTSFNVTADDEEYVCAFPSGDAASGFGYNVISMAELVGTYKFAKTYDGTATLTEDMASGELGITNTTLDFENIELESYEAGTTKARIPATMELDAQTSLDIMLSVPVEIAPAPLEIIGITTENKEYDGTTEANVTEIEFDGLIGTDALVFGTDYTVTAEFEDEKIGENKTVNVTVTLADTVTNYSLETTTTEGIANIVLGELSGTADNGEGTFTYETSDPVLPLVKAEGEPEGSDFMIIEKDESQTTSTYYFIYKVKLEDLAGKSDGTVYIALSKEGDSTRKFNTKDVFEKVTIEGKTYTPPEGHLYFVYAVSDVPNTEQLFCSPKVILA